MPAAEKSAEKSIVPSLAKGFKVLEALTSTDPEASLAEVARRTGTSVARPSS